MFLDENLFLEDDNSFIDPEMDVNEIFDIEESTNYCEGVDGWFEIALESEMSWNNIVNQAMNNEFNAIRNESVELLNEGISDFFHTVIEWVKKTAKAVAGFFKDLFKKMTDQAYRLRAFAQKNKDKISKFKGSVKVEIYDWTVMGADKIASASRSNIAKLKGTINSIMPSIQSGLRDKTVNKNVDGNTVCQRVFGCNIDQLNDHYPLKFRSRTKSLKSVSNITAYLDTLLTYEKANKEIKGDQAEIYALLKDIESNAKAALSATKKSADGENKNDQISAAIAQKKKDIVLKKECKTIYDKAVGISISLCNQYVVDALKICKAALKDGKDTTKKNESFSMFDFI